MVAALGYRYVTYAGFLVNLQFQALSLNSYSYHEFSTLESQGGQLIVQITWFLKVSPL